MAKKNAKKKEHLACARCGKDGAILWNYFGEYMCQECAEKAKVEDMDKISRNQMKLF